MLYRELGSTGEKVSILGFGAMRLPTVDGVKNQIDKEKASEMLEYGIKNGINYIDTAYPYHGTNFNGEGESERFLGEFLSNGYRDDIFLSTKMPSWIINSKEDMENIFNRQLELLQTDYLDAYMIHSVKQDVWDKLPDLGLFQFLDDLKSSGNVKYVGFSFHDSLDLFLEVIDGYEWDITLTQMNYLDTDYQSGITGLQYSDILGLGNVVMEPLRGGKLSQDIPPDILKTWDKAKIKRSPVEWAFKYLYNMKEVDVVLSGMNTLEQVKENIAIANNSYPNTLNVEEKELIREVAAIYKDKKGNDCNGCGYCMPCPYNVNISDCFKEYNVSLIFDEVESAKHHYKLILDKEKRASNCTDCKKCIRLCTQQINIPDELKKVVKLFGE
ncbi:MAG: aldo/keto reductase [Methanobrevibacter sp.]|jgi:predicted aldo/keto reductase-like oxidoreductase|nr:aldo/keto reductase [Methanobrevibacter sp.]